MGFALNIFTKFICHSKLALRRYLLPLTWLERFVWLHLDQWENIFSWGVTLQTANWLSLHWGAGLRIRFLHRLFNRIRHLNLLLTQGHHPSLICCKRNWVDVQLLDWDRYREDIWYWLTYQTLMLFNGNFSLQALGIKMHKQNFLLMDVMFTSD